MNETYTIRCTCHTYVTLEYGGQFVRCYDNDMDYMEGIIEAIEKRTKTRFSDIPRIGLIEDFDGLRFLAGGFKKGAEIFA